MRSGREVLGSSLDREINTKWDRGRGSSEKKKTSRFSCGGSKGQKKKMEDWGGQDN